MTITNESDRQFIPSISEQKRLRSLDVCTGAGGLALGLEQAGFDPVLVLDNSEVACETLTANRTQWDVRKFDLFDFDPGEHQQVYDVDLLSAGLPRVKATATVSRKRGDWEEIRLLEATKLLVHGVQPRALLIENVPDLAEKENYEWIREKIAKELDHLGYEHDWFVLNAADYGVPQRREQGILVAFRDNAMAAFKRPPKAADRVTVGMALEASMASRGWPQAAEWAEQADQIAPTLVGGSEDRGGPDLGPSGSKKAWAKMGVNARSLADESPGPEFRWNPAAGPEGMVRLTVDQAAILQGFPEDWHIRGRKTKRYRQVGQASPPPVGLALGRAIRAALESH